MKKIAFVLALMMMLGSLAQAQDVITLRHGKEVKGYVKDVTKTEVRYSSADNPDGPVYSVAKKDVALIQYQNGAVEEFAPMKEEKEDASEKAAAESSDTSNRSKVWRSELWTNQRTFGIMPYANVGGFFFTGMQLGAEVRWHRFALNGFMKLAGAGVANQSYLRHMPNSLRAEGLGGFGLGWTMKIYLPLDDQGASLHLGLINERTNYHYDIRNEDLLYGESWNTASKSSGFGVGYSKHSEKGLFWGVSGYCGISVFSGDVERIWDDGNKSASNEQWGKFYGVIEASIGWEIPVRN